MRGLGAALLCLLGACFSPGTVECASGALCPAGLNCVEGVDGCFTDDQLAACAGAAEGDSCMLGDLYGICRATVCIPATCGNTFIDPDEQCDDGDAQSGDGCSETCQLETCGNSVIDPGEQCDCGDA